MSEPITMYKAHHWGPPRIEEIRVEKLTAKTAMVIGRNGTHRESLLNSYEAIFPTWEEARDWLLKRCENQVRGARRELDEANGALGNVKGWVKP